MKPKVITKYHEKVIWKTLVIVCLIAMVLYALGRFVPSVHTGKQSTICKGARNTLADLEKNPAEAGASNSKLADAKQLVETECTKDS